MPVTIFGLPYFLKILSTDLLLKKLFIVGTPFLIAILHILGAGSIPKIFVLFFLKAFSNTPTLLPISMTRSFLFNPYFSTTDFEPENI